MKRLRQLNRQLQKQLRWAWHMASDRQEIVEEVQANFSGDQNNNSINNNSHNIRIINSLDGIGNNKSNNVRVHSDAGIREGYEQFMLGPLLELMLISHGVGLVGTCYSTFSRSAKYFGMLPEELVILKRTNFERRYWGTNNCPEMPEEPEQMCWKLMMENANMVKQVINTPPFIECSLTRVNKNVAGG